MKKKLQCRVTDLPNEVRQVMEAHFGPALRENDVVVIWADGTVTIGVSCSPAIAQKVHNALERSKKTACPETERLRRRLRALVPHPPLAFPPKPVVGSERAPIIGWDVRAHQVAFVATQNIGGTVVRAGDFLLSPSGRKNKEPKHLRGKVLRVPRSQLGKVAANFDTLEVLEVSTDGSGDRDFMVPVIKKELATPQRRGWLDATSPLIVVRDLTEVASSAITADSDDAALFELLSQVGGRMPAREEAR